MHLSAPSEAERAQVLEVLLRSTPVPAGPSECGPAAALAGTAARLSAQTEGYSPADLAALVREAALAALEEDMDATAVHPRHFEAALRRVWPSLRDIPPELERVYATFARGLAGSAGKSL